MTGSLTAIWKFALRDLRGGVRHFRVFALCLILGVAAIAAVGSLTEAIVSGLRQESQSLLGGDLEFRLNQRPATPDERNFMEAAGAVSETLTFRGMVHAVGTGERTLATIKAVDRAYPLYGSLDVLGPEGMPIAGRDVLLEQAGAWGALMAPELAERLGITIGDRLEIGAITTEIRGLIQREPDRANEGFELAPRVMLAAGAMAETKLLVEGSLVNYRYRVKLPQESMPKVYAERAEQAFPNSDWRVLTRERGAPRLQDVTERLGRFLILVGLTTLVVGGVGIAGAARSYLEEKTETIAILKALGTDSRLIGRIYLCQIGMIAALCILVGLGVGAFVPFVAAEAIADKLPVPPELGIYAWPLAQAAIYGALVVIAFTLPPIMRSGRVPAAALFRRHSGQALMLSLSERAVVGLVLVILFALPLLDPGSRMLILGFELGVLGLLLLLWGLGGAIKWSAAQLPRSRNPILRLAIGNLHRPGAPTGGIVLALGLGLTLFATLALVEGNLSRQIQSNLPKEAPAFFFIDLQPDQYEEFKTLATHYGGADAMVAVPYLRGTITAFNGQAPDRENIAKDARWALRGDRGLTFSSHVPDGNELVSGDWWPDDYAGPPQISMDDKLADGLGLQLGDRVTLRVLGRDIEAELVSLRRVNWGTIGINFAIVFDPRSLSGAPYSYLATLQVAPEKETPAYKAITNALPNLSAVRMKDVYTEVGKLMSDMGGAVRVSAAITFLAGLLVLAGATAAGARERIYDAVILKLLGGTRGTILSALVVEYGILGLVTGMVAGVFGTLASLVIVTQVLEMTWAFLFFPVILTLTISILVTILAGLIGTWKAMSVRPAQALRTI